MSAPTYVEPVAFAHVPGTELEAWPLPPESLIEGDPAPRGHIVSKSPDDRILRGVWEADPSTFDLTFDSDETMVVLSGRMTIAVPDGPSVDLGPGDMAFFAEGTPARWTVHERMRKTFHCASSTVQATP